MSYSAVATTGIYCRPGCSARPHRRNVRTYELAAAAEANGYRACLRCRPYRTEQPVGRVGPELVCRAVRLVIDGALDNGASEDDLASRLAVSARHLRRLFVKHAGVTPDQLARSRRAHFARRLLDDTDLSITEIAFAAGFGSARQLNRACLQIFRASPTQLRARRRQHDRLVADGGLDLRLPYAPTLQWHDFTAYLDARAMYGVESIADGVYRRTIVVEGNPGVIELKRGGRDHLVLTAHLPHWDGLIHVVQRGRRIPNLDADLGAARAHLRHDRVIGQLMRRRPGLRPPGTWDPFEIGVRAIIGQQVSVAGASTIAGRLVQRHGLPVPGLGPLRLTHLFPPPEALATANLDAMGLPQARVDAIQSFAAAVATGEVRLDRSVELHELVGSLVSLPGMGPWTAHYLALRMGEPDAFPASDLGLRKAAGRILGRDQPLPARELERMSESWRPFRAFAAVHLWAGL